MAPTGFCRSRRPTENCPLGPPAALCTAGAQSAGGAIFRPVLLSACCCLRNISPHLLFPSWAQERTVPVTRVGRRDAVTSQEACLDTSNGAQTATLIRRPPLLPGTHGDFTHGFGCTMPGKACVSVGQNAPLGDRDTTLHQARLMERSNVHPSFCLSNVHSCILCDWHL